MTGLLRQWSEGDQEALNRLVPLMYAELRRLAHQRLRREQGNRSLNTTGLVHDAYLKLMDVRRTPFRDRAHFLAMASRVMRRLLVDQARARRADKRGGGAEAVELDEALWVSEPQAAALSDLDEALQRLEALDPRQGQIVEQRYFGGLSLEEIAEAIGVSLATVKRELRFAHAWLAAELGDRRARVGTAREAVGGAERSVLGRRRVRASRARPSGRRPRRGRSRAGRPARNVAGRRRPGRVAPADIPVRAGPGTRPARIGVYDIIGVLGAGGMGEVYRARDPRLQREVAIKVLPAALTSDPERLARFEREAQVLASLNHPHVAQVYGLDESGSTPALVMELVEGPTLAQVIADDSDAPLTLTRALTIARQIADGLDAAHEKGIIHRDLKPGNVALTPDGDVKILDFGVAKSLDARAAGEPGAPWRPMPASSSERPPT